MKIAAIPASVSFGHKVIVDIGASNPKGTCKVLVKSDDGRDLYKKNGFLNHTTEGFKTFDEKTGSIDGGQADFISKLDDVIFNAHQDVLRLASEGKIRFATDKNGSDDADRKLSSVAVFVPGTTFTMCKDDRIAFIPNLRNDKGESILNVDFKEYEREIKENGRRAEGLDASDDFELVVTKDLGGAGLAIAKILAKRGELKSGDYIMGVMTGGGFGSVDIKVKGSENEPYVEFETSESSSYLTGNTLIYDKITKTFDDILTSDNPKEKFDEIKNGVGLAEFFPVLEKLGRQGVSVKSHIKCFLNALELPLSKEESAQLLALVQKVGDARIVTNDKMYVSKEDKKLYQQLKTCEYFAEIESDNPEKYAFSMNHDVLSDEQIKRARMIAVNDYANSVSLISINKINDCINKVYLVGPFAQGLNRHIMQNQEDYGAKNLSDLIRKKIDTNTDENHVDLPSTKRLMDLYNFEVICDSAIDFPDNTFAGDILLDKKLEFTPNRGSWFSIPLKTLVES